MISPLAHAKEPTVENIERESNETVLDSRSLDNSKAGLIVFNFHAKKPVTGLASNVTLDFPGYLRSFRFLVKLEDK